jgi:hypothetical protein
LVGPGASSKAATAILSGPLPRSVKAERTRVE